MAKAFKMKASRAQDVCNFLNGLSPQEIAKVKAEDAIKNIRFTSKLIEEIEACNKEYAAMMDKVSAESEPKRKELLDRVNAARKEGKKEDEMNAVVAEVNEELGVVLKELEEKHKTKDVAEKEVDVLIVSDERFVFLKDLFAKLSPEKFRIMKAIVEIADALDGAKEA